MAHSVGEQAARAVKNSERKKIEETRTPEAIIKGIRGNLAAHLAVTPNDTQFLLNSYDSLLFMVTEAGKALDTTRVDRDNFAHQVGELQAQVDRFREVYQQENRGMVVAFSPDGVTQIKEEIATGTAARTFDRPELEISHEVDHGGEA